MPNLNPPNPTPLKPDKKLATPASSTSPSQSKRNPQNTIAPLRCAPGVKFRAVEMSRQNYNYGPNYNPNSYHTTDPRTSDLYFTRLAAKAAPPGTITIHTDPSAQPAHTSTRYVHRSSATPSPPRYVERYASERYQPAHVEREREVRRVDEREERRQGEGTRKDSGIVGKGVGAVWRALGGR